MPATKQQSEPTVVLFGNPNPQMQVRRPLVEDGEIVGHEQISVPAAHLSQSVTRVELAADVTDPVFVEHTLSTGNDRTLKLIERALGAEHRLHAVAAQQLDQIVSVHAAGGRPAWVACPDHPELEAALAAFFDCPAGEPTALLTNGGRDALHAQHMSTSAPPATFNYVGLTANSTAPAAGDTTLTAEIATAGGGLIRKQVTYAHTTGTNTTTLTGTFTANGSDALPVTIAKIGVFNASTSGTMGYETLLSATATLSASGDNMTLTETVTAG